MSGIVRDAFAALGHDAWSCDLLPTERPGAHYQGDVRDILEGWQPVSFTAECDPDGDGWCAVRDCDIDGCKCIGPTQDGIEYLEKNGVLFGRPEDNPHWDLMIAHPDCTFLTNSAAWAFSDGPYHQKVNPGTLVGAARRAAREDALDFVRLLLNAPIDHIAIENPVGAIGTAIRPATQFIQPYDFGDDASKITGLWLKNLPPLMPTNHVPGRMVLHNGKTVERWGNQTDSGQNKLTPSADRWKERARTYQGWADAMAEQWGGLCLSGNMKVIKL